MHLWIWVFLGVGILLVLGILAGFRQHLFNNNATTPGVVTGPRGNYIPAAKGPDFFQHYIGAVVYRMKLLYWHEAQVVLLSM